MKKRCILSLVGCCFFAGLFGCTPTTYENSVNVRFCVQEQDNLGQLSVEADIPHVLFAVHKQCLGPEEELRSAHCEVDVQGNTLFVDTRFRYTQRAGTFVSNTLCELPAARCSLPALAAGEYQIVHGEKEFTFNLPSSENLYCERAFQTTEELAIAHRERREVNAR